MKKTPNIVLSEIKTRAPQNADKDEYKKKTIALLQELDELQNLLYAESRHALLVVIQGMDASGKDGLIKDVFGSMNPQGVQVKSFKVPTEEENAHDFLWRVHSQTPARGMIKVFNRSHYEDILVTRVHGLCNDERALERAQAINNFEQLLQVHGNTTILKLYLHVSQKEQMERLKERIEIPRKMWKYNANDFKEAERWDAYRQYYEFAINYCNKVPWHVIPADQNWYKSFLVAELLHKTLSSLKMKYPGLKKA